MPPLTIEGLLLKVRQRKLIVILVPILTAVYLTIVLILRPMTDRLAILRAEEGGLAQKAEVLTSILKGENIVSVQRKRLLAIEERSKLIEALSMLAGKSGLAISSVAPEEKTTLGRFLEMVQVRIEAEGNYHQLADFVSNIENLEQFAKVMEVDINLESPENVILASRSVGLNANGSVKSGQLRSYRFSVDIGFFALQKGML